MASPSQSKVCFFFDGLKFKLPDRTALKHFITEIFRKEKQQLQELNLIFCTDKRLLEINRDFLQHNYYTDIITFDLTPPGAKAKMAEIYISVDRVRDNAKTQDQRFQDELHRVIFHGALHLCGFKDKSAAEKALMRKKEEFYLEAYFR